MTNKSQDQTSIPSVIVIFGITGDLSQRYLLPALAQMAKNGSLSEKTRVIGVSRRPVDVGELFELLTDSLARNNTSVEQNALNLLENITSMHQMDLDNLDDYKELAKYVDSITSPNQENNANLLYLSVPPNAYSGIISRIGQVKAELGFEPDGAGSKLLIEKPFGYDLDSAKKLLETTAEVFQELDIYRIDHFLAKQAVADFARFVEVLRARNDNLWSAEKIEEIEIIASEAIDIQGRVKFYESLGALKDFIQNHLIQLLALSGLGNDKEDLAEAKADFLATIKLADSDVRNCCTRAQYIGYKDEVNNQSSNTETFAAINLSSIAPRWQGTNFKLWTGKALDKKQYAVKVLFKDDSQAVYYLQPAQRVIVTGGTDSIASNLVKEADAENYRIAKRREKPDDGSYERVIAYASRSDHSIFASAQDVLESWRIINPVIQLWSQDDNGLVLYKKGAAGPINNV